MGLLLELLLVLLAPVVLCPVVLVVVVASHYDWLLLLFPRQVWEGLDHLGAGRRLPFGKRL